MASNIKKVLLKKQINKVVYDLYVKTSAELVMVGDSQTLTQKLAVVDADVADAKAKLNKLLGTDDATSISKQIDDKVAALKAELTNEKDATSLAGKIAKVTADLTAEATRAKAAEAANAGNITKLGERMTAAEGKITTLVGKDANKSVRTIANEELAAQLIPDGAKESLDTLGEIASWIQNHPDDAAAMNKKITDLTTKVGAIPTTGTGANSATVVAYAAALAADAKKAGTDANTAAAAAKAAADAEATRAKGAEGTLTTNLNALTAKVGTVPATGTGAGSATVVAYAKAVADAASAAAATAKTAADNAKKAADAEAARAKGAEGTLTAAVNARARFFCQAEQPADLADTDIWAQIIE